MPIVQLPLPPPQSSWPSDIHSASTILDGVYDAASSAIDQSNLNLHRIEFHMTNVQSTALPILKSMGKRIESLSSSVLKDWMRRVVRQFGNLYAQLLHLKAEWAEREATASNVYHLEPLTTVRSGKRGRPRKVPEIQFLRDAFHPSRRITVSALARKMKIHRNTLRKYLKQFDIDHKYATLSDQQLDKLVRQFKKEKPESGIRYLMGHLRSHHHLRIQRKRVMKSLQRVDPLRRIRQKVRSKIPRRDYRVSRPNALWHIDGHHKLILWGIVIHGCVDGYSRTITGLQASTDNKAETVLAMFLDAILEYGIPSRLRGDRGGENRDVAILMILLCGPDRASFMWGSSTFNTRIKRLWVEVGSQFARAWRAFFYRLERRHLLERANKAHLWLLHFLFLDAINEDCKTFQKTWNSHPIAREGHDRSPDDMRLLGQLEHGVYDDECRGWSLHEIQTKYGVEGSPICRRQGHTGAGYLEDEDGIESKGTDDDIEMEDEAEEGGWFDELQEGQITDNIRHEPIPVPNASSPFQSAQQFELFTQVLHGLQQAEKIPTGVGLVDDEWDEFDGRYPPFEFIPKGIRRGKELRIDLPHAIWYARAVLWGRALVAMNHVLQYGMDLSESVAKSEH